MTLRESWKRRTIQGISLSLGIVAAIASADSVPSQPATIYQRNRAFRIPFQNHPNEKSRRREVQLWVSEDRGKSWKPKDSTTPDQPSFTFQAAKDGEYWLAVRTVDDEGRLHPSSNDQIVPSMKVVVDTTPPTLALEPEMRSASLASILWKIGDDHPDVATLTFEYQVEGRKDWQPIPRQNPGAIGCATWDAGYTSPLRVRATVSDRAGNRIETFTAIPGQRREAGSAATESAVAATTKRTSDTSKAEVPNRTLAAKSPKRNEQARNTQTVGANRDREVNRGARPSPASALREKMPESASSKAQGSAENVAIQEVRNDTVPTTDVRPAETNPLEGRPVLATSRTEGSGGRGKGRQRAEGRDQRPSSNNNTPDPVATNSQPSASDDRAIMVTASRGPTVAQESAQDSEAIARVIAKLDDRSGTDPFVDPVGLTNDTPAEKPVSATQPTADGPATFRVNRPRFTLPYGIQGSGPEGLVSVELWVTRDGGRTWKSQGKDPDKRSPFPIELGDEGTYGFSVIARDEAGQGEPTPSPGDPPQVVVEYSRTALATPLAPGGATSKTGNMLQRLFRR
ncbi:hypothetical protein ACYOEI_01460 [Singulisphaera rosea]